MRFIIHIRFRFFPPVFLVVWQHENQAVGCVAWATAAISHPTLEKIAILKLQTWGLRCFNVSSEWQIGPSVCMKCGSSVCGEIEKRICNIYSSYHLLIYIFIFNCQCVTIMLSLNFNLTLDYSSYLTNYIYYYLFCYVVFYH